ncbi:P-loop containing nucleoside triphosphate hydrolase protein [Raphanus sativus]|nr:P-loop containing nucleoside triphosphate hydrolase protein [Raphanus sativus]
MASFALLRSLCRRDASSVSGYKSISASAGGRTTELRLDGVKDIIPIASGKGGVGKSSTADNMSCLVCHHCNEASFIFGKEGAHQMAAKKLLSLSWKEKWRLHKRRVF